jgi:hypothetical protein
MNNKQPLLQTFEDTIQAHTNINNKILFPHEFNGDLIILSKHNIIKHSQFTPCWNDARRFWWSA